LIYLSRSDLFSSNKKITPPVRRDVVPPCCVISPRCQPLFLSKTCPRRTLSVSLLSPSVRPTMQGKKNLHRSPWQFLETDPVQPTLSRDTREKTLLEAHIVTRGTPACNDLRGFSHSQQSEGGLDIVGFPKAFGREARYAGQNSHRSTSRCSGTHENRTKLSHC